MSLSSHETSSRRIPEGYGSSKEESDCGCGRNSPPSLFCGQAAATRRFGTSTGERPRRSQANGTENCQRANQRQLAQLIGTTASVICRLEDANYEGHSLAMLNRIAAALNQRAEIRFVPAERRLRSA